MQLLDKVTTLKGVGPKKAEILSHMGIETIEDLMLYFPRSYEDRSRIVPINQLKVSDKCLIKGRVVKKYINRYGIKQRLVLKVQDATGSIDVVFFNAIYIVKAVRECDELLFYGSVSEGRSKIQMLHPSFGKDDGRRGLVPVYPIAKGISQSEMRKLQKQIKDMYNLSEEIFTDEMLKANKLCPMIYALENVHFPNNVSALQQARYRFIYDELLVLQTGLFAVKKNLKDSEHGISMDKIIRVDKFVKSFPYEFTNAQKRCIGEIVSDMESSKVMNRLVQGDVGSGKTAVAEVAMYKAVCCGYQAVLMAPTEILAKQHYESIGKDFAKQNIKVGILTGSMSTSHRRETLDELKNGEIQILIGTHALIQPDVIFNRLGLVITDEQHRFGVNQRITLKSKGENPDVLVMTATPIPRTLAVILYGDLDVSVIDELPPGRKKIETKSYKVKERNAVYDFVEDQLRSGGQAYVVTSLIEESETIEARSAEEVAAELTARFSNYNVALIHGNMKQTQKDEIMSMFAAGLIDVLVATVVIEVGINVPNANIMVIENAERFGLAQLHQLRGRVGRGYKKSYCCLILGSDSEIAKKRVKIMEESADGFFIAEEDLKLRGPGEIFGTRQHGLPDLNIADLAKHIKVLDHAKETAMTIVREDPMLENDKYAVLRRRVVKLFGEDFMLNL